MPNMQECMKSHPMMHTLTGLGLGLVLANLLPGLAEGLMWGLLLVAVGVVGEFMVNGKKKR